MTLPEVLLWQAIRGGKVSRARFRRQHPVGPYILDFFCARSQLGVEVDGAIHDDAERWAKDRARDRFLLENGIRVLRINARDVLDAASRQDVLSTIAAAVDGAGT